MTSIHKMFTWLESRVTDLGGLQQSIFKIFGNVSYWIQVVLYAILIFLITSIPGVRICPLYCLLLSSWTVLEERSISIYLSIV